ncbi:MAG TPA: hypothetical protein VIL16_15710 [Trebonia sp.]
MTTRRTRAPSPRQLRGPRFPGRRRQGDAIERADWLDGGVSSADARFLMVTAITHHRFSSPIWGAREVRKLQAELAEIAEHAAEILHERQAAVRKPRPAPQWRGIMAAPAR